MKTTAAYYFLVLYTLAVCKPILPFVQDELAHIFWKAKHLATVHHHHGDHHAEKEVAKAAHHEHPDKHPATTKTSEPVSVHIVVETLYGITKPFSSEETLKTKSSVCTVASWMGAFEDAFMM